MQDQNSANPAPTSDDLRKAREAARNAYADATFAQARDALRYMRKCEVAYKCGNCAEDELRTSREQYNSAMRAVFALPPQWRT